MLSVRICETMLAMGMGVHPLNTYKKGVKYEDIFICHQSSLHCNRVLHDSLHQGNQTFYKAFL